ATTLWSCPPPFRMAVCVCARLARSARARLALVAALDLNHARVRAHVGFCVVVLLCCCMLVAGMENPTATFCTPALLAGDQSLTDVIAHEIAHSWTGNLVTNSTWQQFFLNEGVCVCVCVCTARACVCSQTRCV
ncbi:hypothetical protein EON67_04955, partial [archaeon]